MFHFTLPEHRIYRHKDTSGNYKELQSFQKKNHSELALANSTGRSSPHLRLNAYLRQLRFQYRMFEIDRNLNRCKDSF